MSSSTGAILEEQVFDFITSLSALNVKQLANTMRLESTPPSPARLGSNSYPIEFCSQTGIYYYW